MSIEIMLNYYWKYLILLYLDFKAIRVVNRTCLNPLNDFYLIK